MSKLSKKEINEMILIVESSSRITFTTKKGDLTEIEIKDSAEAVAESLKRFKSEIVYFLKKQLKKHGAN